MKEIPEQHRKQTLEDRDEDGPLQQERAFLAKDG